MTRIEYLGPLMGLRWILQKLQAFAIGQHRQTRRNSNGSLASRTFIDTLSQFYNITSKLHQLTENVEWKWGWEGWTWCIQRTQICQLYPRRYLYFLSTTTLIVLKLAVQVSQLERQGIWKLIAFLSKSLNTVGRNCEIHDREMSAIMRGLEEWRHCLQVAHHPVEIDADDTNLEYFVTGKTWPSSSSLVPRMPIITLLWFMNRVRPWGRL